MKIYEKVMVICFVLGNRECEASLNQLRELDGRVAKLETQLEATQREQELFWGEVRKFTESQRLMRLSLRALWYGAGYEGDRIDLLQREINLLSREISLQRALLAMAERDYSVFSGTATAFNEDDSGSTSPLLPPSIGSLKRWHSR